MGFPGGSEGKESACNAGDVGSILGLGRSPGGGHGNPLQYSCLENPHGQRRLAGYSPWGHKESDTTEQLSTAQHSKYMYVSIPTYPTLRLPQLVSTYLLSMFVSLFLGNIFDCHNLRGWGMLLASTGYRPGVRLNSTVLSASATELSSPQL